MKKYTIIAGLSLLSLQLGAQNMYDALRYSSDYYTGSARTLALGNAVTATGGDVATIAINPAGGAVSGFSQVTVTPGLNISSCTAQGTQLPGSASSLPYCYDSRLRTNRSSFALPNLGVNLNFNTGRKSGVKSWNFGVLINNRNYYQDRTYASGNHDGTSLAGYLASQASGTDASAFDASNAFETLPANLVLAWKSGMISTIGSASDVYAGATEKFIEDGSGNREFFIPGTLKQEFGREISGAKDDYLFNFGMNISDLVYLGFNLGTTQLSYSYDEYQRETPVNESLFDLDFGTAGVTNFKSLKYNNWYTTKGLGFLMKFGVIVTPGPFRIGLAVQTPTWFNMTDSWGASARTEFSNSAFNGSASAPEGSFKYSFTTPWKGSLGVAATLGGMAVISADYEFNSNRNMRFSDGTLDNASFSLVNQDIRNCLGSNHQLRVGAEVKPLDFLAVRAGYNYNAELSGTKAISGDEYVDAARIRTDSHSASVGLGFSSKGSFFADLAFRALVCPKEYVYPYPDYDFNDSGELLHYSPEIAVRRVLYTAALTIGFRF